MVETVADLLANAVDHDEAAAAVLHLEVEVAVVENVGQVLVVEEEAVDETAAVREVAIDAGAEVL